MTVRETAAGVGESSVHLRVGEKLSVRDLLAAALIQSANDAAFALAAGTAGDVSEFVGLMNAKARQLGLTHTHFVRPDGLDVPGHYSSARDVLKLARVAMKKPLVRRLVAMRSATIAGGRSLFSWNDLLGRYPGLIGVKTGHTDAAGWCEVAAARRDGVTIYTVVLGSPTRAQRNADLARLLAWGQDFFGRLQVVSTGHTYATSAIRLEEDRLPLVAARPLSAVVRVDQPLVETVVAPALVAGPVEAGASLGEVRVAQKGKDHREGAARCGPRSRGAGVRPQAVLVLWADARRGQRSARDGLRKHLMIVTVTLNAAMDRTLSVPNLQLGQRHRASLSFASAGGKGINVARALKRLGVPVVATGLAGGRNGTLIVEDLTSEGILNDFVRIRGDSRTSLAVLDPISNAHTEINEWGPEVDESELETMREKLDYLTSGAEFVVLAGSLPRGVDPGFYGDLIRDLNRKHVLSVLDCDGEPLRLGVEAEPYLVSPNMTEAEPLVGHEFTDPEDLVTGLDEIAELGARNVVLTVPDGCYALLREDRSEHRLRGRAPILEAVSAVGAGDVLLAAFIAARAAGRPLEDAVRSAVAAGAASVLEAGAGRFDPREASRLAGLVEVDQLDPVGQDV